MSKEYNKTTITLSIPLAVKAFLDELAKDGYNRSALMLKLMSQMKMIYEMHPGIPLPKALDGLVRLASREDIEDIIVRYTLPEELRQEHAYPWNTAGRVGEELPHEKPASFSDLTRVE